MDKETEQGYERAQDAEMEARQEANDAQQRVIDSRIYDLWCDKATLCQAIEENLDRIVYANYNSHDVAGDIEKIIDNHFNAIVINELNL